MRLAGIFLLGLCVIGSSLGASFHRPEDNKPTCGYESCTKSDPDKINIHMVAHTHDDVGWLKTVDQYFYGARMNIQVAGVEYIIDSVVDALDKDPARKFIYVETAFLWKWWQQQTEKRRDQMRKYISEGRLEIIGGGWSMNDEAVTHYHSMIDQYTWGFRRLNDTFGSCARPKIGWQIDPFGHSREQASMFAQLGFDGMLFGRLDHEDKSKRLKTKTGEFVWKGSASLGKSAELFTSMLYNNYGPPPGFCFDVLCQDAEPLIDDKRSPDYNIHERIEEFLAFVKKQSKYYRTNNVILTMGGDFTYMYADMYFKNLDKLISYVNQYNGSNFNAFYSTPSCYLKSLNEQNLKWPTKTDDFFPYSSDPHAFWTGYYSSRPTLKYFERLGNGFLQTVKQLSAVNKVPDSEELQLFREAMGVMQHHDAVTGTEKQHVAEDYARLLHKSFQDGGKLASKILNKWAMKKQPKQPAEFHSCLLLNVSSCEYTSENKKFVVSVYNPTSHLLTTFVRVPVRGASYGVLDYTGKELTTQVVPIFQKIRQIPGRSSSAVNELVFEAADIPALGFLSFYVNEKAASELDDGMQSDQPVTNKVQAMNADSYTISMSSEGELTVRLTRSDTYFTQSFHYYEGATGNNEVFENRSSGAYIFRPKENSAKNLPTPDHFNVVKGPLVEEYYYEVNEWVSEVARAYRNMPYIEFNWLVGPIPVKDAIGKEVITRFSIKLRSNGEFYTDSNGREMLKRKRNHRPTWNLSLEEPVAGNYYPVTSKITIEDREQKVRLSVLPDRSQGGTSLEDGQIELMLHRRLLKDDAFGVGEALNESAYGTGLVARGQLYVLVGDLDDVDGAILAEKKLASQLATRPWIFVTPVTDSFKEYSEYYSMKGVGLANKLPPNVQILTLEPWKDGQILLRLEHTFEKNEADKLSAPVDVDLKEVLAGFEVKSIQETTLGANQWASDMDRLKWQSEAEEVPETGEKPAFDFADSSVVTLKPMEIRTFVVTLATGAKE